jgi:hypothetical protein
LLKQQELALLALIPESSVANMSASSSERNFFFTAVYEDANFHTYFTQLCIAFPLLHRDPRRQLEPASSTLVSAAQTQILAELQEILTEFNRVESFKNSQKFAESYFNQ